MSTSLWLAAFSKANTTSFDWLMAKNSDTIAIIWISVTVHYHLGTGIQKHPIVNHHFTILNWFMRKEIDYASTFRLGMFDCWIKYCNHNCYEQEKKHPPVEKRSTMSKTTHFESGTTKRAGDGVQSATGLALQHGVCSLGWVAHAPRLNANASKIRYLMILSTPLQTVSPQRVLLAQLPSN